mmetsp:Transcript_68893/g.224489  ORF Transcript_68893/g.224489 Transcript_68893/m.224489 type:complete len:332 (+) Transcript_68893:1463-2458(+)
MDHSTSCKRSCSMPTQRPSALAATRPKISTASLRTAQCSSCKLVPMQVSRFGSPGSTTSTVARSATKRTQWSGTPPKARQKSRVRSSPFTTTSVSRRTAATACFGSHSVTNASKHALRAKTASGFVSWSTMSRALITASCACQSLLYLIVRVKASTPKALPRSTTWLSALVAADLMRPSGSSTKAAKSVMDRSSFLTEAFSTDSTASMRVCQSCFRHCKQERRAAIVEVVASASMMSNAQTAARRLGQSRSRVKSLRASMVSRSPALSLRALETKSMDLQSIINLITSVAKGANVFAKPSSSTIWCRTGKCRAESALWMPSKCQIVPPCRM